MQDQLENTLALLKRTPKVLDALLRGLPEVWVMRNEGGESWTVFDVMGHLIDADRVNWMPRARRILESNETRRFDAFDRGGHKRETEGRSFGELLDTFAAIRARNLDELRGWDLAEAEMAREGEHPALGVITLRQLLAAWAAHDLTHLHQISRIMAYQYREAVGPWSKFLGVLHCAAHSERA
jgi:DinB superfamily